MTHPNTHPWVWGVSTNHKSSNQNWIMSIRSRFIQLLVIWPDPTHWPTQPPTHGWVGGWGVSTNHKSSNRIELPWLGQWLIKFLVIWPDPIHWPTHPPNHLLTHPPMDKSGGVSTNHKSSNRIELSWFSQQFIKFLVIWPDPTHQPKTHQIIHHPWVEKSPQISNLQTELKYLD